MEYWAAFTLGFVGSLHCAGMCGPLAIAVPVVGVGRRARVVSRLVYNAGRIATYGLLGMVAGTAILAGLLVSLRWNADGLIGMAIMRLKRLFGAALRRRTHGANLSLGLLNGLLPCGLVYVAAAAAVGTGHVMTGALHMLAFGLGTLPMMLGLGLSFTVLNWRGRWRHLVPASVAMVGVLLILRGAALGIPLLSPAAAETGQHCALCVEKE